MKLSMSIDDNFSSYIDSETGVSIFVDTFDNSEFDVRIGTIEESVSVGTIKAASDAELNERVVALYNKYKESK